MCFAPQRRALFRHRNLQKVVRQWSVLYILTSKCALRHKNVHFFDISTSKNGPTMMCFVHFDFEMCFALQRRAICSSLIWPAGSAPALASLLFNPEPPIIGKRQCFATFLPFRASAFSFFCFFLFYSSLFSSFSLCPALLFICPYSRKFHF